MTSKIIVALDYEKEAEALALVDQIDPSLCRLKVGKEMFTTLGMNFVKHCVFQPHFQALNFANIHNNIGQVQYYSLVVLF